MRRAPIALAALLFPAALSAQDRLDVPVLMCDLTSLSADDMAGRATGTPGSERARAYIARRLTELGFTPTIVPFRYPAAGDRAGQGANVVATIRGTERPEKVIVVSAHYDHLGTRAGRIYNGADDNASGVAALLALADALNRAPPRHSVILVAFDAEEIGFHGVRDFLRRPPVPLDTIVLNLNLDMLSRREGGGVLWAAGPRLYPALRPDVAAAAAGAAVPLRFGKDDPRRPGRGDDDMTLRSDQGWFGRAGIPFVLFHTGEHGDYHEPTDDAGRVDPAFYSGVVAITLAAFRRLDANPGALDTARRHAPRVRF